MFYLFLLYQLLKDQQFDHLNPFDNVEYPPNLNPTSTSVSFTTVSASVISEVVISPPSEVEFAFPQAVIETARIPAIARDKSFDFFI